MEEEQYNQDKQNQDQNQELLQQQQEQLNEQNDKQIQNDDVYDENDMPLKKIKDSQGNIIKVNNNLNENDQEKTENININNNNNVEKQENKEQIKIQKPSKPNSAFIIFIKSYKEKFGDKINLSDGGKIWKDMPKDQKEEYYRLHDIEKQQYTENLEKYIEQNTGNTDQKDGEINLDDELEFEFPVSRIKGILKQDPSLKGIQKDALMYLEKATELFGSLLIEKCERNMQSNKRKTMQSVDIQTVSKQNPYFNFLQCVFDEPTSQQDGQQIIHEENEQEDQDNENQQDDENIKQESQNKNNQNKQKKEKKGKVIPVPKNNTTLDMFFKKKPN